MSTIELAQEAEQSGDVCGTVFIEAMQTDEGVEHEQLGPERQEGSVERLPIALDVETQARCGDDVQVEVGQRGVVIARRRSAV